jgi:Zn-dependent protease with chaperone function
MLGRLRTLLFLALLALSATPLAAPALAAQAGSRWVAVDEAPLRAAPSAEAGVLARLKRGTEVRLLLAQGKWSRILLREGQEGWLYQGHLSGEQPSPALGNLFAPLPQSIILAEAPETARSTRSHSPVRTKGCEELMAALDLRLTPEGLEDFLRQGGIGEFAKVRPQSQLGQASFPPLRVTAQAGGEAERQVGLNLAYRVVRKLAKPAFGVALTRYVNLVGLSVARNAPGHLQSFRVVVLDLTEPVSFSLPGGLVMLSTGLLAALENEAQLALILAHEASHAALGHLWSKALLTPFFRQGGVVDAGGAGTPQFASMLDELQDIVLVRGQDRTLEFDADAAALEMAYRAGYDPKQLPRAIRRIEEAGMKHGRGPRPDGSPQNWSSLHPPTPERVTRVRMLLSLLPQQDGLALATGRFQSSR